MKEEIFQHRPAHLPLLQILSAVYPKPALPLIVEGEGNNKFPVAPRNLNTVLMAPKLHLVCGISGVKHHKVIPVCIRHYRQRGTRLCLNCIRLVYRFNVFFGA